MEDKANEHPRPCPYCNLVLSSRSTLLRHKRRKHPAEVLLEDNKSNKPLRCRDCDFRCHVMKTLIHHYKTHGRRLIIREKNFINEDEFSMWKKDIEKKTRSHFVLHRGKRETSSTFVKNYYCNRSGFFIPSGVGKKVRVIMTVKINYTCSAFMRVECQKSSGKIKVEFCFDHTHDLDKNLSPDSSSVHLWKKVKNSINKELEKPLKIEVTNPHENTVKIEKAIQVIPELEIEDYSNITHTSITHIKDDTNFRSDSSLSALRNEKRSQGYNDNICSLRYCEDNSTVYTIEDSVAQGCVSNMKVRRNQVAAVGYNSNKSGVVERKLTLTRNVSLEKEKQETLKIMSELVGIVTRTSSSETLTNIRKHMIAAYAVGKNLHHTSSDHNYEHFPSIEDEGMWECCINVKSIKTEN
ncbi:hypothetical protein SK128_002708 [Halocaridina rubra]|uniref:C2H2-type domain-containing protein n=1 Tax=Halocaridina rubra TaxID=373956 RepID=A0AAN9A0G1_HALRR